MKIVMIEDEKQLAGLYSKILDSLGSNYMIIGDAKDALKELGSSKYDLLFIDLMLPGINGVDLIEKIRKMPSYKSTSLVVLTNMGSGFDRERLEEMGVKEILLKLDVGPTELKQLIKKYS